MLALHALQSHDRSTCHLVKDRVSGPVQSSTYTCFSPMMRNVQVILRRKARLVVSCWVWPRGTYPHCHLTWLLSTEIFSLTACACITSSEKDDDSLDVRANKHIQAVMLECRTRQRSDGHKTWLVTYA